MAIDLLVAGEAENPIRVLHEQVSLDRLTPEQLGALENLATSYGAEARGGLMFSLAPTLRALTTGSPITTAINEARRMARRHLEAGGAVMPVDGRKGSPGFVVPADVDVVALAAAIEAKLRAGGNAGSGRSGGPLNLLERRPDGRLVVPRAVLEQLGTGDAVRGEQLLERLVSEMRSRRILVASRTRQR